jgi:hypothetical protein
VVIVGREEERGRRHRERGREVVVVVIRREEERGCRRCCRCHRRSRGETERDTKIGLGRLDGSGRVGLGQVGSGRDRERRKRW